MARIIRIARCPRCTFDVRKDSLVVATSDLLACDEDAGAFWPEGSGGDGAELKSLAVCRECYDELVQLRHDRARWARELRAYEDGR